MKKFFAIALAVSMMTGAAQAQEAFKHLGMSIEAGTTGAGINLSYPLVSDHIILTLGYNLPTFTYKTDFDLKTGSINGEIDRANGMIDRYNDVITRYPDEAAKRGLSMIDRIENVNKIKTDIEATIDFGNFKALIEYYPTKSSNFHFTAGLFIGSGDWISVSAQADQALWNTYLRAIEQNSKIVPMSANDIAPGFPSTDIAPVSDLDKAAKFNIYDQTFLLDKDSKGHMDAKLTVMKAKPYIGIGFGNSVPVNHRVGFQMELGAYYHGRPSIESPCEVNYDSSAYGSDKIDDVMEVIQKMTWYPQLTFRITGRIF